MGSFQDIVNGEAPTLVDFFATWCGPCKAMQPLLDQLKNDKGEKVRIVKIDNYKYPYAAEKFKVRGVPTFVLFKSGEIIWRQSGGMPLQTLKDKITPHI